MGTGSSYTGAGQVRTGHAMCALLYHGNGTMGAKVFTSPVYPGGGGGGSLMRQDVSISKAYNSVSPDAEIIHHLGAPSCGKRLV